MKKHLQLLNPTINDKAVDHRGAIYSFVPDTPIVEFCYQYTNKGNARGFHCHNEYDEYVMVITGEMIYVEHFDDGTTNKIVMGPGDTVFIPKMCYHSFIPITDCKSVNFLTKKYDDCLQPFTPLKNYE
jgi:oxalate decarboxylase/phosphoglucose isomerase-like protein (cupin superfamily)